MTREPGHTRTDRLVTAYARTILRRRWLVLAGLTLFVFACLAGLKHIQVVGDYRANFGENNPQLLAFEAVEEAFGKSDNVLLLLAPRRGDVFTREVLEAVHWVTEESWQIPYSTRVDSLSNFQHTRAEGDELIVEDLVEDPDALDEERVREIREISLSEPQLVDSLVSSSGAGTIVLVTLQFPEGSANRELEVTTFARDLTRRAAERYPDIQLALNGVTVFSATFEEFARRDLTTLVPVMYAVLVLALFLFLRSAWGTLGTVMVAALAASTAMGIGSWLGIPLTQASSMAPTIILTIAVADGVHILVSFVKEVRRGSRHDDALVESLRLNWQPVFLTSLTTVIGFLSMNFSDNPLFGDLGNVTAIGVSLAWFYSITFLPVFISLVPYRVPAERGVSRHSTERFSGWLIGNHRKILVGMVWLLVLAAVLVPRIELNDTFTSIFEPEVPFRRDYKLLEEKVPGMYRPQYVVGGGGPDSIFEPDYWRDLDRFATWLRSQPEVTHVSSVSDTMKRLNRSMHGDAASEYRLPDRRDLAAQYLLLYEMSLPYGLDLNNQVNVDRSATRLVATVGDLSAKELRQVDLRTQAWLRENAPPAMASSGASPGLMFAHLSERNIEGMIHGTAGAFSIITLVLVVALGSRRVGLLSLVPNVAPTLLAFGIWAVTVGYAGMSVSVVSACSLGIIVDATVHFLSKYLRARRELALSAEAAVRYAVETVGAALWITFSVLIAGFFVLSRSPIETNSQFGLLIAVTIAAALVTSFLLLPTLLIELDRRFHGRFL